MMMAVIGKKDYAIGYDTLEWIGWDNKSANNFDLIVRRDKLHQKATQFKVYSKSPYI